MDDDLNIPGSDEPEALHGFIIDQLLHDSGRPWYVYLRDPTLPVSSDGKACAVGTVIVASGPKAWKWWVSGYEWLDVRSVGHADSIEEAAQQAWVAWQAAPERKVRGRSK